MLRHASLRVTVAGWSMVVWAANTRCSTPFESDPASHAVRIGDARCPGARSQSCRSGQVGRGSDVVLPFVVILVSDASDVVDEVEGQDRPGRNRVTV